MVSSHKRFVYKRLKQTEMQDERLQTDLHEISKPLARYEGDADLEKHLKEREDVADPMYEYMQKKKKQNLVKSKSMLPNDQFDIMWVNRVGLYFPARILLLTAVPYISV